VAEKVTILGLGNVLRRDEGVGMLAIGLLRERLSASADAGPEVDLVEGGVAAFEALAGRGGGRLMVVDAARGGGPPGTVYRAGREDMAPQGELVSLHGFGLCETLAQLELVGETWRQIVIFGVEPEDTGWGEGLSPPVAGALDRVASAVEKELEAVCGGAQA